MTEVQKACAKGKRVVFAGCVPQGSPGSVPNLPVAVVGVEQIHMVCYALVLIVIVQIADVVTELIAGKPLKLLKRPQQLPGLGESASYSYFYVA